MTMGPAAPIFGDQTLEKAPDTLISTRSTVEKSNCSTSWHFRIRSPKAFLEDVQHFAAHIARGPDDGDAIAHLCLSFTERTVPLRPVRPQRKARPLAALRKIHWNPISRRLDNPWAFRTLALERPEHDLD